MSEVQVTKIKDWLGSGAINIFGTPYAGKDTQGKQLAELVGGVLLGGGEILRNSVIPEHVKQIMHAGGLIPTEDYLQIVLPYLSKPEFAGKPMIFSSLGRWIGEEAGVIEAANTSGHPQKAVINLQLEERMIWRRFESQEAALGHERGQRHDDDADTLQVRIEEFNTKTLPVISFYRNLGVVIDVNADQPPEAVMNDIIGSLAAFASE